jgi:cell division protein FtsB
MKRIGLMALALFLLIMLWGGVFSNTALSEQIESRFYNLEADFNRLESRVDRIEAQLSQTGRSPSAGVTTTPSRSGRTVSPQEREKMFDRLATLVIELKQQVNTLEGRVAKLEKR